MSILNYFVDLPLWMLGKSQADSNPRGPPPGHKGCVSVYCRGKPIFWLDLMLSFHMANIRYWPWLPALRRQKGARLKSVEHPLRLTWPCLNLRVYKCLDQIESSSSCNLELLDPNCHAEEEFAVSMNPCHFQIPLYGKRLQTWTFSVALQKGVPYRWTHNITTNFRSWG